MLDIDGTDKTDIKDICPLIPCYEGIYTDHTDRIIECQFIPVAKYPKNEKNAQDSINILTLQRMYILKKLNESC